MKKSLAFTFVLIIFILQFSVLGVFFKLGHAPNLFIAFAVSLVVIFGFENSISWLLLLGLTMDAGSGWMIGSGALAIILIVWLIDKLKIIAELRAKKYLFAVLLSLLMLVATFLFDFLLPYLIDLEKALGIASDKIYAFRFNADYLIKLIYTVFSGIAVYFFARKIKITQPVTFFPRNKI